MRALIVSIVLASISPLAQAAEPPGSTAELLKLRERSDAENRAPKPPLPQTIGLDQDEFRLDTAQYGPLGETVAGAFLVLAMIAGITGLVMMKPDRNESAPS